MPVSINFAFKEIKRFISVPDEDLGAAAPPPPPPHTLSSVGYVLHWFVCFPQRNVYSRIRTVPPPPFWGGGGTPVKF